MLTSTSSLGIIAGSQWAAAGSAISYSTGNVGIGTSSPTAILTLDSSSTMGTILRVSNSSAGGHIWDLLSTGSGNTNGAGRLDIFDSTAGQPRLSIAANGYVGVGTTSPSANFAVSGNAYLSGNLSVGDASTSRTNLGLPYASNADASVLTGTANLGGYIWSMMAWGDSLTSQNGGAGTDGQVPYPTQLGAIAGFSVYPGGIGGQGSGQIAARMLAATSTYSLPTIIWAGRNDYATPTTVEANIASMVSALQSVGNNNYLILSIINGDFSNEYSGQANYVTINTINNYLATTYGSHYVDIRSYLVSQYNPASPIDVIDHSNDVPPSSLRAVLKSGTLVGNISSGDTAFSLNYSIGSLAVGDIVDIDGEKILVGSGSSGSSVTNATRGYLGTIAASHTSGTAFNVYDQLHLSTSGYAAVVTKIMQNEDALLGTSRLNASVVTPQELRKALGNFGTGYFQNYLPVLNSSSTSFSTTVGLGAANNLSSTATYNTSVGFDSLFTATSSTYTSAFGANALYYNTTGIKNSAFGALAMQNNTSGSPNEAFGYQALFTNTTGGNNAAFGFGALGQNSTASLNSAFGDSAAASNNTGQRNVAVGASALNGNTSGSFNTAIGANALYNNTANSATALGYQAAVGAGAYSNQGGVYIGFQAGDKAGTNSDYNTFIGYQAGYGVTTGTRNVLIGPGTIANAYNQVTTGSFNIAIGNDVAVASSTLSNQLNVGNFIYGTGLSGTGLNVSPAFIGFGTSTPYSTLEIWGSNSAASTSAFTVVNSASTTEFAVYNNGNATYAGSIFQSSDQRLKSDVQSLDASSSLAEIMSLNPVSYIRIDQPGTGVNLGFIAQAVAQVFPNLVSTTSPTSLTPDGTLTLNYTGLIAPIVAAIQQLSNEIASIESTVAGFAQSFTTHQLCLTDSSGTTCYTRSQLNAVISQNSNAPATGSTASVTQSTPTTPDASATSTDDASTTPATSSPPVIPQAPSDAATTTATSTTP